MGIVYQAREPNSEPVGALTLPGEYQTTRTGYPARSTDGFGTESPEHLHDPRAASTPAGRSS
jgi:hypothetical protein